MTRNAILILLRCWNNTFIIFIFAMIYYSIYLRWIRISKNQVRVSLKSSSDLTSPNAIRCHHLVDTSHLAFRRVTKHDDRTVSSGDFFYLTKVTSSVYLLWHSNLSEVVLSRFLSALFLYITFHEFLKRLWQVY